METSLVIKVKYGETLRRFNCKVVSEKLDIGIDGLRKRIVSLFSFPPEAELLLTYIDEDNDVVTLVDDEDLHDAVRQLLNPLRITVKLNAQNTGEHTPRASGEFSPSGLPQIPQEMLNFTNGSEILKFASDLAVKASSSSPVIAELLDGFSKIVLSKLNPISESRESMESSLQDVVSGGTVRPPVTESPGASRSAGNASETKQSAADVDILPHSISGECTSNYIEVYQKNGDRSAEALIIPMSEANNPLTSSPASLNVNSSHSADSMFECPPIQAADLGGGNGMGSSHPGNFSGSQFVMDPLNECPFTGMPIANDLSPHSTRRVARSAAFRNSINSYGSGTIFHKGVRCDGCGVYPITGPRFKSKVKDDYDLCHICFQRMGNEADYFRMNRPTIYRHPSAFKLWRPHKSRSELPKILKGLNPIRPMLNSHFVMDVNVLDGTVMAPSTSFTKMWRMRNNGALLWPQGTRLVWIGGDRLSDSQCVELEVPSRGVLANEELDIAVDFTSPEHPGQYCSYWRMALPSGQMFGQRVWVLIQVDNSMRDISRSFKGLNLNLPPPSNDIEAPEIININLDPLVGDSFLDSENSKRTTDLVEPAVDASPSEQQESNSRIAIGAPVPTPKDDYTSVSYPFVDLSELLPALNSFPPPPTNVRTDAQQSDANVDIEKALLLELDEMGFKQVDLNQEVLRMNKYDLEKSVEYLCDVTEWDTMLEELEEMGFSDTETNKRLLKKNNGSIKRVVMDLIAGEKA